MSKHVFITGVSSGIGLALAQSYLRRGYQVYGVSRREPVDLMGNRSFRFAPLDLAQHEEIPAVLSTLLARTRTDLVILNAGILGSIADMGDVSVEALRQVMDVNVWANKVLLDQLFLIHPAIEQVVTVSSGAGVKAYRGWNGYAISKAALNMLTKLYAAERPGTHFSAVAPCLVDTPMQDLLGQTPRDARFDSVDSLRAAKGTPDMPTPEHAAEGLIEVFEKARVFPSGSFVDATALLRQDYFWKRGINYLTDLFDTRRNIATARASS